MLKKFLPLLLLLPVLALTGCTTPQFTRLTPLQQPRNANNLYPVEVEFNSSQESLRWNSIKPYVLVDGQLYPMRQVPMMANRWEGFVPVSAGQNSANYRFKFDYEYNHFGSQPKPDSAFSPIYNLTVVGQ